MPNRLTPMQLRILGFLAGQQDWVTREEIGAKTGDTKGFSKALGAPTNPPIEPGTLEDLGFVKRRDSTPPFVYKITGSGKQALSNCDPVSEEDALGAEQADHGEASNGEEYSPDGVDRRPIVQRQIRERRGQRQFRDALRKRYGDRCVITGCKILAVLEAAHISPYRGKDDNSPANGLLLRADVHTLFDLDLLGIEPEGLRVELHPDVAKEYACFADVTLSCLGEQRPSPEALKLRYKKFRRRLQQSA